MRIKRAVIIAINYPGYYSLAIHYLSLYAYLDASLRKKCKIYTAEYGLNVNDSSIINNVTKLQPDLIAFSCYLWNINRVIPLCTRIKELLPLSKIVLGGQEVTNSTINYLERYPYVDIIVDGEGERAFREILYSMIEDEFHSLKEIRGIQYRDETGIIRNPPSTPMVNLDDIPSPYLAGKVNIPEKSLLGIMIDHVRGCPNTCAFCFEAMRCNSPKAFSLDRVKEEIAWAKSKGYDYFHIMDPVLCLNSPKRMETMNTIFRNIFHKNNYRVSVEVYAENINKNNILYLDCYHIFDIGLQTISPSTNSNINRKLNLDKFVEGFELIKKLNKKTNVYLIYGLPGDTYDTFMDGISFVDSLKPSAIFLNKLCVLDGTPLRHNPTKYNLSFEMKPPYEIISNMTYSYNDIIKSDSFAQNFMRYYAYNGNRTF
jgi:radical SAM superfamily enzyme YgiQ (UPF0313 family)